MPNPDGKSGVTPAAEAGATFGWERFTGLDGEIVGIDHFGASAPAKTLFAQFGISAQKVAEAAVRVIKNAR